MGSKNSEKYVNWEKIDMGSKYKRVQILLKILLEQIKLTVRYFALLRVILYPI